MNCIEADLVGETVKAVYLSEDKTIVKLVCEGNKTIYGITEAECCSETWIEEIMEVDDLLNERILAIENDFIGDGIAVITNLINMLKDKQEDPYDRISNYSFNFKTKKGVTRLIYRNGNNGYYGGAIYFYKQLDKYNTKLVQESKFKLVI